MSRRGSQLAALVLTSGAVLALDFGTKRWATATLAGREPMPILGDLLRLTYTRNPGVAFGIGAGFPFPYYLFSIAAALTILYLFLRGPIPSRTQRIGLALILGGALGNLVDRVTAGEVVDWIEVGWRHWHFHVFNIADSAVSIGVVMFALGRLRSDPRYHGVPDAGTTVGAPPHDVRPTPPSSPGNHAHDEGAGPLRAFARHGGAVGPLPGRGADRPFA